MRSRILCGCLLGCALLVLACGGGGGGSQVTPPSITAQPQSQTVTAGQTATFSVTATGTPTPTYQWIKDLVPISYATSASYTTPTTTSADNGAVFTVTVTNAAGSVTSSGAILTVNPDNGAPTITTQPISQTVTVGQSATFTVVAASTSTPTYQWMKNGVSISGATSNSYTTPTTTSADNGAVFTVTVTNAVDSVTSNPATLTVTTTNVAPTITTQPVSQTVTAGQTATFSVTATGTNLSYQWNRNGVVLSDATSNSYTTPATTLADNGAKFSVTVTNSGGNVTSSPATLTVNAAPTYSYTLITQPDQTFTPIYDLIKSAKKSIDLTIYEFQDDTAKSLLAQAAANGVAVRVIFDHGSSATINYNTPTYTYLSQNGVQVHWSNPAFNYTHQKTLTVDGAVSAVLTFNFVSRYYATGRDYGVVLTDPADVAAIETVFNADFTNTSITPPTGTDLVWSPTNSEAVTLDVINSAKTSLLIEEEEMAYSTLTSALVAAAQRGVNVQLVMTLSTSYTSALNQLKAAGVKIATFPDDNKSLYIHAKVLLADYGTSNARVFIGSENFSQNSLERNRELGVLISDTAVMDSIQGTITKDFANATAY